MSTASFVFSDVFDYNKKSSACAMDFEAAAQTSSFKVVPYIHFKCTIKCFSSKPPPTDDLQKHLDDLSEKLKKDLANQTEDKRSDEIDKNFMNFKKANEVCL